MRGLLGAMRRRWQGRSNLSQPAPFAVTCRCRHVVTGERTVHAQVVRCPACNESVFVFPRSPWPPVPGSASDAHELQASASRWRFWLLPAAAAGITLAAATIVIVVLLNKNATDGDGDQPVNGSDGLVPVPLEQRIAESRKLLKEGAFRLAREALRPVQDETASNAELRQLFRETSLLADLVRQPLEEIVQQAQDVKPAEWEEQFADFRGRSVLFDDTVLCEPGANGRYALVNYQIRLGEERVRIDLDQSLFRQLEHAGRWAPGRPRRLIFGARLASIQLEKNTWVIALENDSTVLMTEEDALTACGFDVRDPELQRVVREQREWLRRK